MLLVSNVTLFEILFIIPYKQTTPSRLFKENIGPSHLGASINWTILIFLIKR